MASSGVKRWPPFWMMEKSVILLRACCMAKNL